MFDGVLDYLFQSASFMPHKVCMLQRSDLVALHAASDALIALAYFAIPAAIWHFVRSRSDLTPAHRRLALLFVAFILMCGVTHLMGLIVLWEPLYGIEGLLKLATAFVSLSTVFVIWPLLPELISLPNPSQFAAAQAALKQEIGVKERALADLARTKSQLETTVQTRTRELVQAKRRFETALEDSNIVVFEQDRDLRYTWLYNAPNAADGQEMIGRVDQEIFPSEVSKQLVEVKRRVLAQQSTEELEIAVPVEGGERWYRIELRPLEDDEGLIATATDMTQAKSVEGQLTLFMRELAHRTKNIMAVISAIARQTAKTHSDPHQFQKSFLDRLGGLGATHEILLRGDWGPVQLGEILQAQFAPYTDYASRITVEGPAIAVPGVAAQHIGLAIHELVTNAAKYGALSTATGRVNLSWTVEDDAGVPSVTLSWREIDGPPAIEPNHSGFGTFLTTVSIERGLHGRVERTFGPEGFRWQLTFALGRDEMSDEIEA